MTVKDDHRTKPETGKASGSPDAGALEAELDGIYVIELCSGEHRRWRYLGPGEQSRGWWRDLETGLEFSETSLMYAWRIIDRET